MEISLRILHRDLCHNTLHGYFSQLAVQRHTASLLSARTGSRGSVWAERAALSDQSTPSYISYNLHLIHLNIRKWLKGAAERCNKWRGLTSGTVLYAFFLFLDAVIRDVVGYIMYYL